ncbi:MAG: EpsG family protein [Bacteroidales bacterium]|nr:EpsG family protein [Lachnoclostridium sp.]MCM1383119.1 EpsG family protein [Lachnoclostridium sp.]MCM1465389.1 EpsG family protein [Bacteroidales bacterium]
MEPSVLVYIILTILTVALAMCVDNREYVPGHISGCRPAGKRSFFRREQARNLTAEWAVFCLLTGVSACRIAVGNDYWPYRFNFRLIAQERHVSSEFGFNLIVKGMQDLFGYDNYLPIFALFSFLTVFFFTKALHDQGVNYAFSLFLLMTGGYYFNSLNSVRYYLALAIALYAMKYVIRGEYGKFVLWVLFGTAFHKSILLVIPVYLAARWLAVCRLKWWHYGLGGLLAASLLFGQDVYREIIFYFYPYYRNSAFDNGEISYVNLGKCAAVLILSAICYKRSLVFREDEESLRKRFYFFLNVVGLAAYCCGSFIPEVSRVGYYMIISQIFLLPELIGDMKKGWFQNFCRMGVIGAFILYFIMLLKGMYAVDVRLLPYLNWIFN